MPPTNEELEEQLETTSQQQKILERNYKYHEEILEAVQKQTKEHKNAFEILGNTLDVLKKTKDVAATALKSTNDFVTNLYGLKISPLSILDPRGWDKIAAELKDTNSELFKLGVRAGKGAEEGKKLSATYVHLEADLGETAERARNIVATLSETNYIGNINEAAETISLFSRATGVASENVSDMMDTYKKVAGIGEKDTTHILANITKIQQSNGITKKGMDALVASTKTIVTNMRTFGRSDQQIKQMTISTAKLVSELEKVGVAAQDSTKFIEDLLDPEKIEDNIKRYAALGISISDALSGDISADQVGAGLKEFGQKLEEMGPIAGAAYAKAFGISYKDAIKASKMEEATVDEIPVDESVKAMQDMKQATLDATAQIRESMNKMEGQLKKIGDGLLAGVSFITKAIVGAMGLVIIPLGHKIFGAISSKIKKTKEEAENGIMDISKFGKKGTEEFAKNAKVALNGINVELNDLETKKKLKLITDKEYNSTLTKLNKVKENLLGTIKESEKERYIKFKVDVDNGNAKKRLEGIKKDIAVLQKENSNILEAARADLELAETEDSKVSCTEKNELRKTIAEAEKKAIELQKKANSIDSQLKEVEDLKSGARNDFEEVFQHAGEAGDSLNGAAGSLSNAGEDIANGGREAGRALDGAGSDIANGGNSAAESIAAAGSAAARPITSAATTMSNAATDFEAASRQAVREVEIASENASKTFANRVGESAKNVFGPVIGGFKTTFKTAGKALTTAKNGLGTAATKMKGVATNIATGFSNGAAKIRNAFKGGFGNGVGYLKASLVSGIKGFGGAASRAVRGVAGAIKKIPSLFGKGWRGAKGAAGSLFKAIVNGGKSAASRIGAAMRSGMNGLGGMLQSFGGKVGSFLGKAGGIVAAVGAAAGVLKTGIGFFGNMESLKNTPIGWLAKKFGLAEDSSEDETNALNENTEAINDNTEASEDDGEEHIKMSASGQVVTTGSLAMKTQQSEQAASAQSTQQTASAQQEKQQVTVQNDPKVASNTSVMVDSLDKILTEMKNLAKAIGGSTVNSFGAFQQAAPVNTSGSLTQGAQSN